MRKHADHDPWDLDNHPLWGPLIRMEEEDGKQGDRTKAKGKGDAEGVAQPEQAAAEGYLGRSSQVEDT